MLNKDTFKTENIPKTKIILDLINIVGLWTVFLWTQTDLDEAYRTLNTV